MEVVQAIGNYSGLIQSAVILLACAFMIYMRSVFVTKAAYGQRETAVDAKFTTIEAKQTEIVNRLDRMNDRVTASPTKDDVHHLTVAMTQMGGDMRVLSERLNGHEDLSKRVQKQLDLVDTFLRQQK